MADDQTINTIREQKRALRKEILAIRDALDVAVRKRESEVVRKKIAKLPAFCKAQKVLLFASYGSEIETDGIIEDALAAGKEVYLPRVQGEDMVFYRIEGLGELVEGYKGIREPKPLADRELVLAKIGAKKEIAARPVFFLLPGVVFDREGNRIGYGKGFYDRFQEKAKNAGLESCAIALSCQLLETGRIPSESHDRKVPRLITAMGEIAEENER